MSTPEKDLELWQAYLRHEDGAFECLYLNFVDRLYAYGCRLCSDHRLVEDAIQDTFIKIYRRKHSMREVKNIRSYLFVSLRNHVHSQRRRDLRRQRRHETFWLDREATSGPTRDGEAQLQLRADLQAELAKLPPRQQEILFLKFFEGLDYDEISEVMSISYQVARNYLYRGLRRLRQQMGPHSRIFVRYVAS